MFTCKSCPDRCRPLWIFCQQRYVSSVRRGSSFSVRLTQFPVPPSKPEVKAVTSTTTLPLLQTMSLLKLMEWSPYGVLVIVASNHSGIHPGERVYGYLAPTRYLLLPVSPSDVNKFAFYVPRPHLPAGVLFLLL
jgi:hypothetical protein